MNARIFPANLLKIFPYPLERRSSCGLFPIGEKREQKNGLGMRRRVISAQNAVISSSGVLRGVTGAKYLLTWINAGIGNYLRI